MNVLLVANYENDRQESMLRFAAMLESELQHAGVKVKTIRPRAFFGALKPGATGAGKWLGYLDKFLLFPFALKRAIADARGDLVVHVCDHSNAFYTRYLQGVPHVVTCNDLLAVRCARGEFPGRRTGATGRVLQRWILEGLRRARRITCISEAVRRDVVRLAGNGPAAVDVTPMGLHPDYASMPRAEALEKVRGLTGGVEPFILHVGGNQWYKNRLGVLMIHEALSRAPNAPRLVMVGPPFDDEMEAFVRLHPSLAASVVRLHDVDNQALRALYSAGELLLFPSFEEGFGWPIVEAQACGCPVATTAKEPMSEVGGAAASLLPEPPAGADLREWSAAAAQQVRALLNQDGAEREAMVSRGLKNAERFTAAAMAARYIAIYQELL